MLLISMFGRQIFKINITIFNKDEQYTCSDSTVYYHKYINEYT